MLARDGNRTPKRGRLGVLGLLACLLAVYGVIALINPWATHMGGRWTPMLIWTGTGQLVTKSGTYPIFVTIYPSQHSSTLRLDGLRPVGGVHGTGLLCAARGTTITLNLTGTIYGGWRSTEGDLLNLRLLEYRNIDLGQRQGYFDLYGYWHGPQVVMDDRGRWSETFRSGLRIEHASLTLNPGSKSDFKTACASMGSSAPKS